MKAIKICVETCKVFYIDLADDYRAMYQVIGNGCDLIAMPVRFSNGDYIFVDDEGWLRDEIKGFISMPGWRDPIAGNALIVGSSPNGDLADCKTTIEEVKKMVTFIVRGRGRSIKVKRPRLNRTELIQSWANPSAN